MSIPNKPFRATVKKIVHNTKYTTAQLSTSRKNTRFDDSLPVSESNPRYIYSTWGFTTFLGSAHEFMMSDVEEGDLVNVTSSSSSNEMYTDKAGERKWSHKLVVFEVEMVKKASGKAVEHASEQESEEYPF